MGDHTTSNIAIRGCNIGLMRGGSGPPLVLLHGASGAGTWLPCMGSLAEKFDVIVPEHPGFGASDTPEMISLEWHDGWWFLDFDDQN